MTFIIRGISPVMTVSPTAAVPPTLVAKRFPEAVLRYHGWPDCV